MEGWIRFSITRHTPLRCIILWLLTVTSLDIQEDWCRLAGRLVPKKGTRGYPEHAFFCKKIKFLVPKAGPYFGPDFGDTPFIL